MESETVIAVSVLGAVCLLLLVLVAVLFSKVSGLRKRLDELSGSGRMRVQKLSLDNDKNHAFHNPTISPDEELARRGFSMYAGEDLESGRPAPTERQTGGQLVDELARELDYRHQRQQHQQQQQQQRPPSPPYQPPKQLPQSPQQQLPQQQQQPPPFLLQSIEENKRKTRKSLANPVANGGSRQSETNPNFIY